ncbi:MAG: ATP-dependent RNA helicase RhlE [Candidatus Azotimanducaceae bacterium]|jgi:ATP-dependent RNA helicase RhlE
MTNSAFAALGLADMITAVLTARGYGQPTPVQQQAIPAILAGRDVLAAAQTGTGKTAGFVCPMLQRLHAGAPVAPNQARALILVPTRELALQVAMNVEDYGQLTGLRSVVVFGGVKINPQMMALRRGADILVATPGRLLDLVANHAVSFENLEVLVLDEADRMLDLGFSQEISAVLSLLPTGRQSLMFSATFSESIRQLAKMLVKNPVEIVISPREVTAKTVTQWLCPVDKKRKPALLVRLIFDYQWQQLLVFTATKRGADQLVRFLHEHNVSAAAVHGDRSQQQRMQALADFKQGRFAVLVATDVAARGLDIEQLPQVVNFDLPKVAENYIHRIGRTGRAGASGEAVSLVSADEIESLKTIEQLIQQVLPRKVIDDFEPDHQLPASPAVSGQIKKKKPKKPKKPGAVLNVGREAQSAKTSARRTPAAAARGAPSAKRESAVASPKATRSGSKTIGTVGGKTRGKTRGKKDNVPGRSRKP